MEQYFEINGTLIKLKSIKDFQIIQREYIYRPTYRPADKNILNTLSRKKFTFLGMQPYAAIVDEKGYKSSLSEYQAKNFKESVGKDFMEGALTSIADKFNIKTLKYKKYICVNQTGRTFTTYLEDIPALVMSPDGKISDIYKNDEMYSLLGEPIAPAINIIHALLINTEEKSHIFYGNGIHLEDVTIEYQRLKQKLNEYHSSCEYENSKNRPSILPTISLLKIGKKDKIQLPNKQKNKSTEERLSFIKNSYANGNISEAEYQLAIEEIMKNL